MDHQSRSGVLDLETIKARAESATEGPWVVDDEFVMHPDNGLDTFDGTQIARIVDHDAGMFPVEHNGDFIAHARTDVPALVAEVERLRGIVERVREVHRPEVSDDGTYCVACSEYYGLIVGAYPCPPIRALEGP